MRMEVLPLIKVPEVYYQVCSSCHSVKTSNLKQGRSAPDLSEIAYKAKKEGGFVVYIERKYKVDPYEFFLYPSKYVPEMALVEGKIYSKDVDELITFIDQIPPAKGDGYLWLLPLVLLTIGLIVLQRRFRDRRV